MNGEAPLKKQRISPEKPVTVVLGTQWGDEGKGKIVDMLAAKADICCRCQVRCLLVSFSCLQHDGCLFYFLAEQKKMT